MTALDWDTMPRLLQDLCDGHPGRSLELYRLELPNGVRQWLCKRCWVDAWIAAGRPEQTVKRGDPIPDGEE